MPYEWIPPQPEGPLFELHLWPHRSLSNRGFVRFIWVTFLLLVIPLYPIIGSPTVWVLLPFLMGCLALLYYLLHRNYRDGEILEVLRIWPDKVTLERHRSHKPTQDWKANPHWVELKMRDTGGPVPHYVTLRGGDREVEIGAFLSDDERVDLYHDLSRYLPLRE